MAQQPPNMTPNSNVFPKVPPPYHALRLPEWSLDSAGGAQQFVDSTVLKTRRRMARERRGAGSSVVSFETLYYKTIL